MRIEETERSPKTVRARVRGMGVAVIMRRSGRGPLRERARRWRTPKRCCSSTTVEPEALVLDLVGEEGLGAEDEVHLAGLERREEGARARVLDVAREEGEPDAEGLEEAGGGRGVLAGEELGRAP